MLHINKICKKELHKRVINLEWYLLHCTCLEWKHFLKSVGGHISFCLLKHFFSLTYCQWDFLLRVKGLLIDEKFNKQLQSTNLTLFKMGHFVAAHW